MKEVEIKYESDEPVDGEYVTYRLVVPAKNQLCDRCEGDGKVDNPAFSNGITQEDREEMGEEDFQSYMDGAYDVVCPDCRGAKVVIVPDVHRMTYEQKRFAVKVRQEERGKAQDARESAAMHRAECWYMYQ